MKKIAVILCLALAACLFPSIGAAAEQASNQSVSEALLASDSAREKLVSLLEEARNYTLNNGTEEALKAFSDPRGGFIRDDMYVFAYDFNGTLLAHPYLPGLIGRNNTDLIDPNGVPMIGNLIEIARRGHGFAYNVYPNPNNKDQTGLKLLYVLRVDDNLWLGSGIYLPGNAPLFSFEEQRSLKAFVDGAKDYALKNGQARALAAFNDPKGEFVQAEKYIFAYDLSGKLLSMPLRPELVGRDRLDIEDPNAVAITRDNIDLARNGSGKTYYLYPNPGENMSQMLKLSYSTAVNDSWVLGAGIYVNSSSALNMPAMKPANAEELKTFVEEARTHALVTSKNVVLKEFMNLNGSWVRGDVYIFAHDFNGTCLCLPYLPQSVGTNRQDIQNDQGVYINREMSAIAMNGSGYYEYQWNNPITNQSETKVSYVTKVDDTWYLGAGIYQS
jgi:polar amino acid transport system substrate-binding protein